MHVEGEELYEDEEGDNVIEEVTYQYLKVTEIKHPSGITPQWNGLPMKWERIELHAGRVEINPLSDEDDSLVKFICPPTAACPPRRPGGRRRGTGRPHRPQLPGSRRRPARAARRPGGRQLGSHGQPAQRPRHLEAADLEAAAVLPEPPADLEAADLEAAVDVLPELDPLQIYWEYGIGEEYG
jgi:hypothetical protein